MKSSLGGNTIRSRNRKNVITLSGQMASFVVELLTSAFFIWQIMHPDLADPTYMPMAMMIISPLVSCVQALTSHELRRFIKELYEDYFSSHQD